MVCVSLGKLVAIDRDIKTIKWHTVRIPVKGIVHIEEMLEYLATKVDGHNKHTYYTVSEAGYIEFRFRHKKDYEWFVLRWQ